MFKKILFPTDFSEHGNAVADCVIGLKSAGIKEVTILHVIDKRIFSQFPEVSKDVSKSMRASAQTEMSKIETNLKNHGLKVEKRIEMGVPFHQIVNVAKTEDVSMIIMSSHGKSLVEEMLLGSTTENVLRHATVPLLVEKLGTKKTDAKTPCALKKENPFKKVLYPTDFSECAESVMPYLKQLKDAGTDEVIVLHVQDMTKIDPHLLDKMPEFENIDSGRLEVIKSELKKTGIPNIKTRLEEGVPFIEIEAVGDEEDVGLIAIGSHGKSMVNEMFLGSVSGKVVRRSKRPILIIRRK